MDMQPPPPDAYHLPPHGAWGAEPVGLPSSGAVGEGGMGEGGMGGLGAAPSPKRRRGAPEGAAHVTVGWVTSQTSGWRGAYRERLAEQRRQLEQQRQAQEYQRRLAEE